MWGTSWEKVNYLGKWTISCHLSSCCKMLGCWVLSYNSTEKHQTCNLKYAWWKISMLCIIQSTKWPFSQNNMIMLPWQVANCSLSSYGTKFLKNRVKQPYSIILQLYSLIQNPYIVLFSANWARKSFIVFLRLQSMYNV